MATYTYLAADLRTNAILAELPLKVDGDISRKLNGYGDLSASLSLNAKGMDKLDLPSILNGGRTALYVDRDGVLGWGGIIWSGRRRQADHSATITALEFESYLFRRFITADYQPTDVDQLTVARTLIQNMQAPAGGDIGLLLGAGSSGVLRSRDYFRTNLGTVGEAIRSLTQMEHGFDMHISVAWSAGQPVKQLLLGYPALGRGANSTGLDFQSPGNITDWTDEWDAFDESCTDFYELGQGEGSSVNIAHASAPAFVAAGYPLLDAKNSDNRDVSDAAALSGLAREGLLAAPIPVRTYACEVKADADPVWGSYIPGDEARFRLYDDDWWSPLVDGSAGFDKHLRIIGDGLNPDTERVTLTLGASRG